MALYASCIEVAGGEPVLLSPQPSEGIAAALDGLAGLCFSGGGDVDPTLYGAEHKGLSADISRARDDFEIALVAAARARRVPVLGICRGCQLLNVAFGGTLYQDIAQDAPFPTRQHKHTPDDPDRFHPIRLAPSSFLADLAGGERTIVNSHHHQAVRAPGEGLGVVAWSEDGIVEGLLGDEGRTLAVQWHPERLEVPDQWPIAWLVQYRSHALRRGRIGGTSRRLVGP
jgi:putative glutamine amidotransferase